MRDMYTCMHARIYTKSIWVYVHTCVHITHDISDNGIQRDSVSKRDYVLYLSRNLLVKFFVMYLRVSLRTRILRHTHVYTFTYTCLHVYIYRYLHTYMRACMHGVVKNSHLRWSMGDFSFSSLVPKYAQNIFNRYHFSRKYAWYVHLHACDNVHKIHI